MAAPIKNQTCHSSSRWSTVLIRTALRSYPSAYPSRLGSLILANQFNRSGMIFFFGVSPFTAFHIPGKVPGTYRHRLYGLPSMPLPGYTRKIKFVTIMSTYKFSLCGSNLSFAGILFFLILFRGNLSCYIQNRKFNLSLMNLFILV